MSFLHFDATSAAAAAQEIIFLQNFNCFSSGLQSYAEAQIFGDGGVWCNDGGFDDFQYNWIDPASSATLPGATPYQIMRSNTTGDEPGGPSEGVWTELVTANNLFQPNRVNGGTGYTNGDVVTVVGGDLGTGGFPTQFVLQNVVGGVVPVSLGMTVTGGSNGRYFTAPNGTHSTTTVSYTGGTGTGLTGFTRYEAAASWTLGASYPGSEYCTFNLSIRKGTGPVLATCFVQMEADSG